MPFRTHTDALQKLERFFHFLRHSGRDEIFISLLDEKSAAEQLAEQYERHPRGRLTGMLIAVKDNIDVVGFDTTAAAPGFAYTPDRDSAVVAQLRSEGALVVGKTNLDQFATGLVGTRSPYGAVRDAIVPERISGGSSSGSAVAVSLGLVDAALGTDTAGSGRIPAGLQGIVGIKPTIGLVSNDGVVPACASYDCVTVLAPDLPIAELVMQIMAQSGHRELPHDLAMKPPVSPVVGIPTTLPSMSETWVRAFHAAVMRLEERGFLIREINLDPSLEAAKMLYDSPLVAERAEAVGEFVTAAGDDDNIDPTVRGIITGATRFSAPEVLEAQRDLATRREAALREWSACDVIMVPTAPFHPDIETVQHDPIGVNAAMGTFTNFCNLFDLCAVAVPAGIVSDGGSLGSHLPASFGVTFLSTAFRDDIVGAVARTFTGPPTPTNDPAPGWLAENAREGDRVVSLAVFGAHLRGQPLNRELLNLGAVYLGNITTTSDYRLFALDTTPPKPGLTGPLPSGADGQSVDGEEWLLSHDSLARLLTALPEPMTLGSVSLSDGRSITGFSFQPACLGSARDITEWGGWRSYLEHSLQQDDIHAPSR